MGHHGAILVCLPSKKFLSLMVHIYDEGYSQADRQTDRTNTPVFEINQSRDGRTR